jgi:hypothetical protein
LELGGRDFESGRLWGKVGGQKIDGREKSKKGNKKRTKGLCSSDKKR